MINLPPGFDYETFINELLACASPFVTIAVAIVAYVVIRQGINKL